MLTPLAQLVRRRYIWNSIFALLGAIFDLLLSFGIMKNHRIYLIAKEGASSGDNIASSIASVPYMSFFGIPTISAGVVLFAIIFLLSLGMVFKWKSEKVIKTIYILVGILFIFSLIGSYYVFFEIVRFRLNAYIHLFFTFLVFVISVSVHYTVLSDQEKRKVCEFC